MWYGNIVAKNRGSAVDGLSVSFFFLRKRAVTATGGGEEKKTKRSEHGKNLRTTIAHDVRCSLCASPHLFLSLALLSRAAARAAVDPARAYTDAHLGRETLVQELSTPPAQVLAKPGLATRRERPSIRLERC